MRGKVKFGWNIWVLLAMLAIALVIGVVNNLRVYEERRVSWFGDGARDDASVQAK